MCKDCGCEKAGHKYFKKQTHEHHHHDDHEHNDHHETISVEMDVLKKNDQIAHANRHWFEDHQMRVINLISSPGAGKTFLLEKTMEHLKGKLSATILVGDQQTDHDAQRLLNRGANVKQINTYSSCHLDASMIQKELDGFITGEEDLLIIENIGNLVCPAAFDLGEDEKIAILSTTEGEDKPVKYPVLFHNVNLVVITKTDLIPHLDWSLEKTKQYIRQINPKAKIVAVSAKTGEGMDEWIDYLLKK